MFEVIIAGIGIIFIVVALVMCLLIIYKNLPRQYIALVIVWKNILTIL